MQLSYIIIIMIALTFLNNLKGDIVPGINAAPNESTLEGEVTEIKWLGSAEDKVTLAIKVAEYQSIFGPAFLEKGQIINGFFYTNHLDLQVGDRISAHVEYIGGPTNGVFQLLEYKVISHKN